MFRKLFSLISTVASYVNPIASAVDATGLPELLGQHIDEVIDGKYMTPQAYEYLEEVKRTRTDQWYAVNLYWGNR
jgi:hypothetical protein